jgi:hypothetical protein
MNCPILRFLLLFFFYSNLVYSACGDDVDVLEIKKVPDVLELNLGERSPDAFKRALRLVNKTGEELKISKIVPGCSCVVVGEFRAELLPNQFVEFEYKFGPSRFAAARPQAIQVFFAGHPEPVNLVIISSVASDVKLSKDILTFDEKVLEQELGVLFDKNSVVIQSVECLTSGVRLKEGSRDVGVWEFKVRLESNAVAQRIETLLVRYAKDGKDEVREFPLNVRSSTKYFIFPREVVVDIKAGSFTADLRIVGGKGAETLSDDCLSVDFFGKPGRVTQLKIESTKGSVAYVVLLCEGVAEQGSKMVLNVSKNGVVVASVPIRVATSASQ